MAPSDDRQSHTVPRARDTRLWRAWADLSLRSRLMVFALGLVTLPGVAFALIAFSGTRAALEREVAIQLQQTAERGADALRAALEHARHDARAWARQDVMRDLLIGDLDKRVSRALQNVRGDGATYADILCADRNGIVVAASRGDWVGRAIDAWPAQAAWRRGEEVLAGPHPIDGTPRRVLELAVPIANPDAAGERIGALILLHDWRPLEALLDGIRATLASLGKRVAALVIDRDGAVIGGVDFDGDPARDSPLAGVGWALDAPAAGPMLVGAAAVADAGVPWSVLIVERRAEALAPVHRVRWQWTAMIAGLLVVGLAVAIGMARQVSRPLEEVTRATSHLAALPDLDLPSLPVRAHDEVGQLTESFNRMTGELKRSREQALSAAKFAFAGELAAMIAHQVRTPLSVMRSSAQMLADPRRARSGEQTELVGTIVAEVDRVEQVVTGLIELARPLEPRPAPTALGELLSRAATFAAAHAERQGIHLHCEPGGDGPRAQCDPEQLYQVVLNLVVNAMQALPAGGSLWLRGLSPSGGMVGFAVADDGPGVPAAIRDQLFRPFVTGRDDGTGLGLAFVERVVKAHRGRVSVHSEPGRGTVFEVRLPVAEGGT
jgi:signal transduction histidine kinase